MYELPAGKRITIAGKTGTGKTTLARRYLAASNYHWVIFNPKLTRGYLALPDHSIMTTKITPDRVLRQLQSRQYVILNFPPNWGWEAQDYLLLQLQAEYENFGICIDELYTLHNNGRAGPGLSGLLTRGRELKQSCIGLTQRPVWVSKFLLSESDFIAEFRLNLEVDRRSIYEATGSRFAFKELAGHDYILFDLAGDRQVMYTSKAA